MGSKWQSRIDRKSKCKGHLLGKDAHGGMPQDEGRGPVRRRFVGGGPGLKEGPERTVIGKDLLLRK